MLTETRQEEILKLLEQQGSVTVQELKEKFDASESTIRRDLNALHKKGALVKVFGGAVTKESRIQVKEEQVAIRLEQNMDKKQRIAQYAASLIEPEDFVYLDAGTTTGAMIPYLTDKSVRFVTNAISHALKLAENGFHVVLIGGELKSSTEAIVGGEAYDNLQRYNFTKGFYGTNGVDRLAGFTTPDINEAILKESAIRHTRKSYVLCDTSKFSQVYPVRFCAYKDAVIITDQYPEGFVKNEKTIIVV